MLKKILFPSLFFLSIFFGGSGLLSAQSAKPVNRILFVFDASQSMLGRWNSGTKMEIAVQLLNELVDSLKKRSDVEIALRMYGHQSYVPPQDCKDTKLEIPFGRLNHERIKTKLRESQPRGTTPIAYSLEQAAGDFPPCGNCRNIIILITDGKEECDGDPCAMSRALQQRGVILKPFIIGIGLDNSVKTSLDCVGNFYNATTEETFRDIINVVITQALNPTTAQVNLLDNTKKPKETNVAMTFYDSQSGRIMHNFLHTMNHADNPDTLFLDNFIKYRLVVHTIPPIVKDNIEVVPGRHNVIAVDAAQGDLLLSIRGRNQYGTLKCIVRKAGSTETLHIQDFGAAERYLLGNYDLEILSLPRIIQKNVKISQSTTTTVEIDEPGLANMQFGAIGYGSIYLMKGTEMQFVCNLNQYVMQQAIVLQPGTYRVVFRYRTTKETILTKDRTFIISPGESTIINLRT